MTTPRYEYNVYSAKGYYDEMLPESILRIARYEWTEGEEVNYYDPAVFSAAFVDTGMPDEEWPDGWGDYFYDDDDAALPWFIPLLDFGKEN